MESEHWSGHCKRRSPSCRPRHFCPLWTTSPPEWRPTQQHTTVRVLKTWSFTEAECNVFTGEPSDHSQAPGFSGSLLFKPTQNQRPCGLQRGKIGSIIALLHKKYCVFIQRFNIRCFLHHQLNFFFFQNKMQGSPVYEMQEFGTNPSNMWLRSCLTNACSS